jgi:uncharacterized phage protein (TIGR01671 family)
MREIKFRCWDIERKRIRGVADIKWFDNGNIRVNATESDKNYEPLLYMKEYQVKELKEFELLQYTGLKDKNGKEIYEKDILKNGGYLYLVEYDNGFNQHVIYDDWLKKNVFDRNEITWLSQIYCDRYEVIGNIYENKELLNETKES